MYHVAAYIHTFAYVQQFAWYWLFAAGVVWGILSLTLQLMGHIVFEGSFPAFRAFEFVFTAPFYTVYMILLPWYDTKRKQQIEKETPQWAGSENCTLPWFKKRV